MSDDRSTASAPTQVGCPTRADANVDPGQREHELADAVLTLLIGVSRYGGRSEADRLGVLEQVAVLLAAGVAERIRNLRGREAEAAFRKCLGQRRP